MIHFDNIYSEEDNAFEYFEVFGTIYILLSLITTQKLKIFGFRFRN